MSLYHNRSASPVSFLRSKAIFITLAAVLVFFGFIYSPLPSEYDDRRDALVQQLADTAKGHLPEALSGPAQSRNGTSKYIDELAKIKSKYAFATFLAGPAGDKNDPDFNHDPYFVATRILAYQLLHAPETRSNDSSIPFVVLVTDDVSEVKRERLRRDGAHVYPAAFLTSDWANTNVAAWKDVLTKLRLWELTQFERICFLDGDTVLTGPMDGIFSDPAVHTQDTGSKEKAIKQDEGSMPRNYSFAGVPETMPKHEYPPTEENHGFPNRNYLNAGLFVFKPSFEMLSYYISLINIPDRFNPELPEQNLLNYAHRREGNMPWTTLGNTWNIHYPSMNDLMGGVRSLHEKWWAPVNQDLGPYLESWRWRMEGYFEARDLLLQEH
ncbi:hypothetical protein H2203_003691 [Taxawa tesnikishii (nom. ined.)]|nr:hypothetical protein H2203_003691 [Dothideales sp. JES 119]